MEHLDFTRSEARDAEILSQSEKKLEALLGKSGGGISLAGVQQADRRYIVGSITLLCDHCVPLMLRFFMPGADKERITIRFGLLPHVKTLVCFDMDLLDAGTIYTTKTPGRLKLVVHGNRTRLSDVERVELGMEDCLEDVHVVFEDFVLSNKEPESYPVPEIKLVDQFGQWKNRDWPGKIHSEEELKERMNANTGKAAYPFPHWNRFGGDSTRKLAEGTGFFSTVKTADGRWHLADPEGCEYFSLGPCGTHMGEMGRIDGTEGFCDWLPEPGDPQYGGFYQTGMMQRTPYMPPETYKMFDYLRANLCRVYGDRYEEKWKEISYHTLMGGGINCQGNFPGLDVNTPESKLPYVRQLPDFPSTDTLIFRDFPDVLSQEYADKSRRFAQTLRDWKDDPFLVGYFMRNEPEFNFVPGLSVANEVLHHELDTDCKRGLIDFLRERYGTVEKLNTVWGSDFGSFDKLIEPIEDCAAVYPGSKEDLREYSIFLIREYIRIPALACKEVDANHLNLGLRWSEAKNPDMMAGWEFFDVFSLNCYAFDPTPEMDFVKNAGVDLPIMIGEFHAGALDRGLPATGLKGVKNQEERAKLWRLYVENCAAHPHGVGAHWFQYNDQFCLGRFDGENYQIGMVDVCMQPHRELFEAVKKSSEVLYQVKNGEIPAFSEMPEKIPMIGY